MGKEPNVRISSTSDKTNLTEKWLHPNMTMEKVQQTHGPIEELKYENFGSSRLSFSQLNRLDLNFDFDIFLNPSMLYRMTNQPSDIFMNK